MSKCPECGISFVGTPEDPPREDHLCTRCDLKAHKWFIRELQERLSKAAAKIEQLEELINDEGACVRYRLEKQGIYVQAPGSFSSKHDIKDYMPPILIDNDKD
jgi:hypothetical protein